MDCLEVLTLINMYPWKGHGICHVQKRRPKRRTCEGTAFSPESYTACKKNTTPRHNWLE